MSKQIRQQINKIKILNEHVIRDKYKKVLFVDEFGKYIIYDDGYYRISVDDPNDALYIILWHKEFINGKEYWAKRGVLDAWKSDINFNNRQGKYLSIRSIEIDKPYRGKGFGKKMYNALINFCSDEVKGIYSYLPNRVNKKEVPKIYNRLGAKIEGDYHFIDF